MRTTPTLLLLVALLGARCSSDPSAGSSNAGDANGSGDLGADAPSTLPMDGLFGPDVTEIALEVDYQTGAAPYVGATLPFGDPWDLFVTNANDLFATYPKTITVPRTLDDMEELTGVGGPDFTSADILAIAAAHRQDASTATRRTFYVVFLDGFYADDSGRNPTVLGVTVGDAGVIAIFKRPIESTTLPRQVEQTTLVHEFGHAVGLVDRGVPMVHDHQDPAHGGHCNNPSCVMYWTVEGSDIASFIRDRVLSSRSSLFGPECLQDTTAAAGVSAP